MKMKEVLEKSPTDLEGLEVKLRQELALLGMQARAGQLANISKVSALKRDIARILTTKNSKTSKGKKL